jgi:hypothetical protein
MNFFNIRDQKKIYKSIFIFNALSEGWTVKKISNNKFEFINKIENCKKEIYLDSYVNDFVLKNVKNIEDMVIKIH